MQQGRLLWLRNQFGYGPKINLRTTEKVLRKQIKWGGGLPELVAWRFHASMDSFAVMGGLSRWLPLLVAPSAIA